jgi:hypothetical protein
MFFFWLLGRYGHTDKEEEGERTTSTYSLSVRRDSCGDPGVAACQVSLAVQSRVQGLASHRE